jgi:hypothetical protein
VKEGVRTSCCEVDCIAPGVRRGGGKGREGKVKATTCLAELDG